MHIKPIPTLRRNHIKTKALDNLKSQIQSKRALYLESIPFKLLQKYDYFWNLPKI